MTQDGASADGDRPVSQLEGCYWHPLASWRLARLLRMIER